MISFFRLLDPVRLIALLLLFLAIRIPMMVKGVPVLTSEFSWMLIGEKMSQGAVLYKDIWYQLEPFSGVVYRLLTGVFGKSTLTFHITNLLLVFAQAVGFNVILNNNNTYNDKSAVPALLYLLFSSLFFDFQALSPVVLGMTFVLLAYHFILVQLKIKTTIELILMVGTLVGIATLFYMSFIFFLFAVIFILLFHLNPPLKMYFTLLTGFLIPYLLVLCYYFLIDGLNGFYDHLIAPFFAGDAPRYISLVSTLVLGLPMVVVSGLTIMVLQNVKYINYQYQAIKTSIIWGAFAGLSLFFVKFLEPFHLFVLVPPATVLGSHYFLIIKNKWIREVSFFLMGVLLVGFNYTSLYGKEKYQLVSYKPMVIAQTGRYARFQGKKMLVVGEDKEPYLNNTMATPYLSWTQSSKELLNFDDYHHLSQIYQRFYHDMPEVIVDEQKLIPKLFFRLPALEQQFQVADTSGIYIRKTNAGL